ncbi:hypothetical protein FVE85_2875 [Porphyridium purpureum]|uniref:Mitochondrial inner membrane protein OXA1L n=1 Tax=Porphyridium purpureum TaxID=35688 RepID=A0A5J4YVA7_PORPP|nr:hypothetical protein FVE85_2875 [Porphyridium purpureum]|eukprot:POR7159..scf227_4
MSESAGQAMGEPGWRARISDAWACVTPVGWMRTALLKTREYVHVPLFTPDPSLGPAAIIGKAERNVPGYSGDGSWVLTFSAFALGLRICLLPLTVSFARAGQKVAMVQSELRGIARISGSMPADSPQQRKVAMRRMRDELFRQYGLSKISLFPWMPFFQVPFFLSAVLAVRSVCATPTIAPQIGFYEGGVKDRLNPNAALSDEQQIELGLRIGGFGDFSDLTAMDVSYVLPALNTFLLLLQIERSIRPLAAVEATPVPSPSYSVGGNERSNRRSQQTAPYSPADVERLSAEQASRSTMSQVWQFLRSPEATDLLKVGIQGSILLLFPLYAALPSGVLVYWVANSMLSAAQPTILRAMLSIAPPTAQRKASSESAPETKLGVGEQILHKFGNAEMQLRNLHAAIAELVASSHPSGSGSAEAQGAGPSGPSADENLLARVRELITARKQSGELTMALDAFLRQDPQDGAQYLSIEIVPTGGDGGSEPSSSLAGSAENDGQGAGSASEMRTGSTASTSIFSNNQEDELAELQRLVAPYAQAAPTAENLERVQQIVSELRDQGKLSLDVSARIRPGADARIELVVRKLQS